MPRRSIRQHASLAALVAIAVAGFSSAALAHIGDHSHMSFAEGLRHPLTGLDHMLAMVAVGLWASQLGRRALWLLPVTFPAVMAIGAAIGFSGVALPFVEIGIAGSVLVLGAAVALALRPSLAVSVPLIALFALLHGYSHGVELPAAASALSYGAGFVAATLALHLIGIAIGLLANRVPIRFAARTAGGAIACVGLAAGRCAVIRLRIFRSASPLARSTLPWRGRVACEAKRTQAGWGELCLTPRITPPRLATSSLADPPPPGEGDSRHRRWEKSAT